MVQRRGDRSIDRRRGEGLGFDFWKLNRRGGGGRVLTKIKRVYTTELQRNMRYITFRRNSVVYTSFIRFCNTV